MTGAAAEIKNRSKAKMEQSVDRLASAKDTVTAQTWDDVYQAKGAVKEAAAAGKQKVPSSGYALESLCYALFIPSSRSP